jgi:hypothetical protein
LIYFTSVSGLVIKPASRYHKVSRASISTSGYLRKQHHADEFNDSDKFPR